MNERSCIVTKLRELLHLTHVQMNNWFLVIGGKEVSRVEKNLDTEKHMRLRLE